MIIKKIKLENIRSYETLELDFPEGSTLLAGDIGSGKTTILLAIEFALFGLQPGQKGSALLRNDKNQGSVYLELEIGDNHIIIERTLKRTKTINQEYTSITINNEKQEKSITEIKNIILSLLNYPPEFVKKTNLLYKYTVYTPQEEMRQIILENPETRLDTLRHVFGVDKYKTIKENTDSLTKKLREDIREKQGIIQDLDDKKVNMQNKQSSLIELKSDSAKAEKNFQLQQENRKKIEAGLQEIEKQIDQKKNFEKEIEKAKILFSSKREMILAGDKEISLLNKQIEEIKKHPFSQQEFETIRQKKQEIENQKEKINQDYLNILSQISSLNLKIQENETLKAKIQKIKLCPTCLQNVDNEYKENIIKKFETQNLESNNKISELSVEKNKLNNELSDLKLQTSELEKKINDLSMLKAKLESLNEKEAKIQEIEKNKASLNQDIALLEKHITALKQSVLEFSKYDAIYTKKQEEFKLALREERQADLRLAELKKEIQMIEALIQEMKVEIEKKEKTKNQLAYATEVEQWLSDKFLNIISLTERNVLFKLRGEFSKLFNEWFNIFVPDIFNVRLDEDFTPVIEQQEYELDYSFLSGGERTAVALAYRLALNQTINSLLSKIKTRDLVILDEPTDGFSEQQLDKMRDVLAQLNVRQLILVSHEAKIESFVENIIKFKKENGISRIEA